MATAEAAIRAQEASTGTSQATLDGTRIGRWDWGIALLSVWLVGGFYVDLWAHSHGFVDDTFFTPWHALLYTGAASFGIALGLAGVRRLSPGAPLPVAVGTLAGTVARAPRTLPTLLGAIFGALPAAYRTSLLGAIVFVVAGVFDLIWHTVFGFEANTESLLSPPHLALATSGILMVSGPIRSVWYRTTDTTSWRQHGPLIVSLAMVLAILAAFTQYANPVTDPWAEAVRGSEEPRSQLYAMAADGSEQRRLGVSDGDERTPVMSPDGTHLAFSSGAEETSHLYVSDADGSNRRQLTADGQNGRPAWSPDGNQIAYQRASDGDLEVWLIGAGGADARPLTAGDGDAWNPAWSPDGALVAFNANRTGNYDLFVTTLDGAVRALTEGPADDFDPAWSPDGSRIAFASSRGGDFEIWSMAADGSDARQLTDAEGGSFQPAYSPDGSLIAFPTDRDGDIEVYVMDADGANEHNVSRNPGADDGWVEPAWSPDGSSILYTVAAHPPAWRVDFVRQGWGAAGVLVHAALIAGIALVALRRGPLPPGALALLIALPTLMMAPVVEQWRFVPGAIVAGLIAEVVARRLEFGNRRATDLIVAFAIPGVWFAAYFATIAATTGLGWTIHLWLGAIFLAGVVGVLLNEVTRSGLGRPAAGV